MTSQRQITTALLTEHFRQTPLSLLDEIINTVNELVFQAVDRLEEALSHAPSEILGYELLSEQISEDESTNERTLAEMKQKEIEIGIVQLESLLNAIVDKDFDKFEIYVLRNILAIGHEEDADLAQWIRLDHYKDLQISHDTPQITPEEVQLQRRKRYETFKLNQMLKQEHARNAAVLEQLNSAIKQDDSPLSFLTSTKTNTSQEMNQILERLPAIQQCLADLKTIVGQPIPKHRIDDDSSQLKRRRYLNTQTLKALEQQGLTTQGSTQLLSGKRISKEEVEGLEAVVQRLGGAEHIPD